MTEMLVNVSYSCSESGHIFGYWEYRTGLPKPTQYRVCVIPSCGQVQDRVAPR